MIEGKKIYEGDNHDVICNGKNHYAVSEVFGARKQCGCFCETEQYKQTGFCWSMLKTPTVDDGIVISEEDDMDVNWFKKYGW